MSTTLVRITDPECGHSYEWQRSLPLPITCPTCDNGVPEGATRCEDYPCCGHTDGDGCGFDPRHTSDYWSERFAGMTQEEMEYMDQIGAWE